MSWRVIEADVLGGLAQLADASVQTVVTSPPYWGLRDYGHAGQLGLEASPEEYVERLVGIMAEVRRVLRPDGTLWLNLGDSYSRDVAKGGSGPNGKHDFIPDYGNARRMMSESRGSSDGAVGRGDRAAVRVGGAGLKPKDLVGIPWRVAFALQADGWYLRSDIIWAKPNPMPESVTDRPTKSHEYVFLLSKSPRYFWDADAVREPHDQRYAQRRFTGAGGVRGTTAWETNGQAKHAGFSRMTSDEPTTYGNPAGRNIRTVWNIATEPFPGGHFATFPKKLVEPCVKAGSAIGDTVLDPFCGSGTTGLVSLRLGRSFVGIELSPEYAQMARHRIHDDAPLFNVEELA